MEERISSLRIIWFFLKQYKVRIAGLLVLSLLVGGLEGASVAAVYPIFSTAFETPIGKGNFALTLFRDVAKRVRGNRLRIYRKLGF